MWLLLQANLPEQLQLLASPLRSDAPPTHHVTQLHNPLRRPPLHAPHGLQQLCACCLPSWQTICRVCGGCCTVTDIGCCELVEKQLGVVGAHDQPVPSRADIQGPHLCMSETSRASQWDATIDPVRHAVDAERSQAGLWARYVQHTDEPAEACRVRGGGEL